MADANIGRNVNANSTATVTTVSINSVTATTILAANPKRIYAEVWLVPDTTSINAYIRPYPAATDNIKQGAVLTRRLVGADNLFNPVWKMPVDNVYTGEISAISASGTFDVMVIEW